MAKLLSVVKENRKEWTNWPGNHKCTPKAIYFPQNLNEVIEVVHEAKKNKKCLRAVGGGHSWSDIACTSELMVSLEKLNTIDLLDREKGIVKVEGGMNVTHFYHQLASFGLDLTAQPLLNLQTVAGIIATATHGMGHSGTLSSLIHEVDLVTSEGKLLTLSPKHHPEWYKAVAVNLGALGIVTSVTFECSPLTKFKYHVEKTDLKNILKNYRKIWKENDAMLLTWNVFDDSCMIHHFKKVPVTSTEENTGYGYDILNKAFGPFDPTPRLAQDVAIAMEDFAQALDILRPIIKRNSEKGLSLYTDPYFRFVQADHNSFLGPSIGRDSIYISCDTASDRKYHPLFLEIENALMDILGRPHWGKMNFLDYDKVKRLYGDNLEKFIHVKKKLDPHDMFSNNFTKRILTRG